MIIVSVTGPTTKAARAQIHTSMRYADLFEIRLDRFREVDFTGLRHCTQKPLIVTCRRMREGGQFVGPESQRLKLLFDAMEEGADYVDIELSAEPKVIAGFVKRTKTIVSAHLPAGTRFKSASYYQRLDSTGASVVKLAYTPADAYELRHVVEFLTLARTDRRRAIAVAMGEFGEASRILYKKFGGWATYAAPENGPVVAPGQLAASVLRKVYHAEMMRSSTRVFGVVGFPVKQSKGVFVHNEIFAHRNSNAVYCRFPVVDLRRFMRHFASFLSGFSVTLPHKEAIMTYLDSIEEKTKRIGAVNTVTRRQWKLIGTNTDAPGALDAIETRVSVKGKRVLIVGAGGAARAVAFEAKTRGAEVLIANRTKEKARKVAVELGVQAVPLNKLESVAFDILVNATPIGMSPRVRETPVPKSLLKKKIVFDAVYNPPMTRLLKEAKEMGGEIIQGTEMYVNQAALQSALYTGTKPRIDVLKRILSKHLAS